MKQKPCVVVDTKDNLLASSPAHCKPLSGLSITAGIPLILKKNLLLITDHYVSIS